MEKLIINKEKLTKEEIDNTKIKSRIIILNNKNELILCNYNSCYLLIGGKVEDKETVKEAALREAQEEIGVILSENDLDDFIIIEHYQKNYPTRDNKIKNNLLITYYFISKKKVVVQKLLDLLYRNQVSPIHLIDVIGETVDNCVLEFN